MRILNKEKYPLIMKPSFLLTLCTLMAATFLYSQDSLDRTEQEQGIHDLIATYAQARAQKDTLMLEHILVSDVDQLVSSGKWRRGKKEALQGMLRSSSNNPGQRTLTVEHIRFLDSKYAVADARYHIARADGSVRKMWSTFIVVYEDDSWKIAAIRNMLPGRP